MSSFKFLSLLCLISVCACAHATKSRGPNDATQDPSEPSKHVVIPLQSGTHFRVSSAAFDCCTHNIPGYEYAWDFDVPYGTEVIAVEDGTVIQVWEPDAGAGAPGGCDRKYLDSAHNIKILARDGTVDQYVHIDSRVHVGDAVKRADVIAVTADNGFHCAPQLHFNIFKDQEHLPENHNPKTIPVIFDGLPGDGVAKKGFEMDTPKPVGVQNQKYILQSDFSSPNWLETFEPATPAPWTEGMGRAQPVDDVDRGHKVLEVKYPKGSLGPEQGGSQWIGYLPKPAERVTTSYWVKFPEGFGWVLGGKLPGLIGGGQEGQPGSTVTGGVHPTGKNGWSARIMWRKDGQIVQYVYHMNQPGKWGEDFKWQVDGKPALFRPGVWQQLTTEVTMNTPGKRNGRIRSWLDGKPALDVKNFEFRSVPDLKIDALYFSTFFGGDDPDWAATKDETIRFDDFKVY